MNTRRSRLLTLAAYIGALVLHGWLMKFKPPGEHGMLLFHTSAALFDWILFRITGHVLAGKLCDHMQALCIASMIGNALGWERYMAYAPPFLYNSFMWGLACAQLIRLGFGDDDPIGYVRRLLDRRAGAGRLRALYETEKL
jgi:hypothetical protein